MTDKFVFGARSEANLVGVNKDLVKVARLALIISNIDFAVTEGVRTAERQKTLYAQGRSAPGKIVTWTTKSRHIPDLKTGLGNALDLVPLNPATGRIDWEYAEGVQEVADSMRAAADRLEIKIRWGKDWNGNGIAGEKGEVDPVHFEIPA